MRLQRSILGLILAANVSLTIAAFGQSNQCSSSDVDRNGVVDDADLLQVLFCFGQQVSTGLSYEEMQEKVRVAIEQYWDKLIQRGLVSPVRLEPPTLSLRYGIIRTTSIGMLRDENRPVVAEFFVRPDNKLGFVIAIASGPSQGDGVTETELKVLYSDGDRVESTSGKLYSARDPSELRRYLPTEFVALNLRLRAEEESAATGANYRTPCRITLATGGCACWIDPDWWYCGLLSEGCWCRLFYYQAGGACRALPTGIHLARTCGRGITIAW